MFHTHQLGLYSPTSTASVSVVCLVCAYTLLPEQGLGSEALASSPNGSSETPKAMAAVALGHPGLQC